MPRVPKFPPSEVPTTRRSSRLNKPKDLEIISLQDTGGGITGTPRRHKEAVVNHARKPKTTVSKTSVVATSDKARQFNLSPEELVHRENTLLHAEQRCQQKEDELVERALVLKQRESDAFSAWSQVSEREAKAALTQLEEYFTCALCYEILAFPYTLNPGQCGHTFCAMCILKWFFSRLHSHCGTWHESVYCPMCRRLLVITPDRIPRPDNTFPFVPNRTAAAACESLIEKLRISPSNSIVVKKEDTEGVWASGWGPECNRKKDTSDTKKEKLNEDADVAGWREGGFMRSEWLKKDREGKKEMNRLSKEWQTLTPDYFRDLKKRLGV